MTPEELWKIARPLVEEIFNDFVTVRLSLVEDDTKVIAETHFRGYQASCRLQKAFLDIRDQVIKECAQVSTDQ